MKRLFLAITILLLEGCTTISSPIPEGYKGAIATLHDTMSGQTSKKVYIFEVLKINDKNILTSSSATYSFNYGRGMQMKPIIEQRKVPAQTSTITIRGMTYFAAPILAFGGGDYHITGNVSLNLKPNEHYYVKGVLSKSYKSVWIEDSKGNIVSEKVFKGIEK